MKEKQYNVWMHNEDDGERTEIDYTGSLKDCRNYIKQTYQELKTNKEIEIYNHDVNSIEGYGDRGDFSYEIIEVGAKKH